VITDDVGIEPAVPVKAVDELKNATVSRVTACPLAKFQLVVTLKAGEGLLSVKFSEATETLTVKLDATVALKLTVAMFDCCVTAIPGATQTARVRMNTNIFEYMLFIYFSYVQ